MWYPKFNGSIELRRTTMTVDWSNVGVGVKVGLKGFGMVLIPWLAFINGG
jgi:hypothetical protein